MKVGDKVKFTEPAHSFFDSLPKGELTIRAVNHIKVLDNWLIDIKELPEDWWKAYGAISVHDRQDYLIGKIKAFLNKHK